MLLSSLNRKYPPSNCFHSFSVVVCLFVTSYSVTYCIYIPGKPEICFHFYCAVYDECTYSDTFWLADRVCLFVHYTISLSWLCKLYLKTLDLKKCLSDITCRCVRLSIFSQLSIIQYVGLCVFSLPIFICDDWENIYTLSYYYHQIGSMNYCPLFRVRSWNNGMRCMSFYILIDTYSRNHKTTRLIFEKKSRST